MQTHVHGTPTIGPNPSQYCYQPTVSCPRCGLQQQLGPFFSNQERAEVHFVMTTANTGRIEIRTEDGHMAYYEHWCSSNDADRLETFFQRVDQRLTHFHVQHERKDAEIRRLHQKLEIMKMAYDDLLQGGTVAEVNFDNMTVSQLMALAQQVGADASAVNALVQQVQAQLQANPQVAELGNDVPPVPQPAQQAAPAQPPPQQ